jgi:hypothetical protein
VIHLLAEARALSDGAAATAEAECDAGAGHLYLEALDEVSQALPELRPTVLATRTARHDLFEAARDGGDRSGPGQRLLAAVEAIAAQLPVLEGRLEGGEAEHGDEVNRPRWDRLRRQLRVGDREVTWPRTAPQQFAVLDALEAAGWPEAGVSRPLRLSRQQLKDALGQLNERLLGTGLQISRDGKGQEARIRWFIATP